MADITQKYTPPSFDGYAAQMKNIEKSIEAERVENLELSKQAENKSGMNRANEFIGRMKPQQTAVEIMAGQRPQGRPSGGGGMGGGVGGGMAAPSGVRNRRADLLGNYMKAKDKEFGTKKKTRLDDEKKLKEIYKAFEYESRGTSHLKKMRIDSMKIDRAMRALQLYLTGKRELTFSDATDLSAAATALITGGMPPEKLIDATTLKTLKGKGMSALQFLTGIPKGYYSREFMLQLRKQFKSFDETVKHDLSKHAVSVWNRFKYVADRQPDMKEDIMRNYGHRLGIIDSKTGLATPRTLGSPYKSFDNDEHTPDVTEHNVLFNEAIDKGNMDPYDVEYEGHLKRRKEIKAQASKGEGPSVIGTGLRQLGGDVPPGTVQNLIGDKVSAAGQDIKGGAQDAFNWMKGVVGQSANANQPAPQPMSTPQPIQPNQLNGMSIDELEKMAR